MTLPTGKKRQNNRLRAFTLIELVLVTLIVLVLIALSTPLFKKTSSSLAVKETSFSIAKLMNYAQEKAILDRKNFKIRFDFKAGRYQMLELDISGEVPVYKKSQGRFGRVYALPQGISFSGSRNEAVFYPDGHCDEAQIDVMAGKEGYRITAKGFGTTLEIKAIGNE